MSALFSLSGPSQALIILGFVFLDEMYEILSNLPESVAYTCVNCTERHPAEWRLALEKELQASLKQVLTALLNSRTTSHLLRYRQVGRGSVCGGCARG